MDSRAHHDGASKYLADDVEAGETTALILTSAVGGNGDAVAVVFDAEVSALIARMFSKRSGRVRGDTANCKFDGASRTNPKLPPTQRFKRHRNFYIFKINQFRHWWKTSRLLVRLSGGYEYCLSTIAWTAMGLYDVTRRKQSKHALRAMKTIGRGGVSRDFLKNVKPFTRSIRILLAVARGWEARVDNRMMEVFIAEAFAFMGNRCSRFIARKSADGLTGKVLFPLSAMFLAPHLDQNSRPVIVTMGFIRAILPFMFSFQGSRFGRQLTFNTWKYALHEWQPVQSIMAFNPKSGVYPDMNLDASLREIAQEVAAAIGHGSDPVQTRENLAAINFTVIAAGYGGQAVFRRLEKTEPGFIVLSITPYGPSILNELARYIVLERRLLHHSSMIVPKESSSGVILNAAQPPDAAISGFLYSSAFFISQEWAALSSRYSATLDAYDRSCKLLNTASAVHQGDKTTGPPKSLVSLKEFIRLGNTPKKRRKDNKRWQQLENEVTRVASTVKRYQALGTAPKQVIVYLEGLDCSAKSSTGGLVCRALEESGYAVRTAQHNRPPTVEQREKPWMDRGRFEWPMDKWIEEKQPPYTALVWDRGPAGDFVYGQFKDLSMAEKEAKYQEFVQYDEACRQEGVLLLKLLFVADKDSIALTLGKRLAHKSIAGDLRTWLDANSVQHSREGLAEIEEHIDSTDFIAFNNYHDNIALFTEFALNTNSLNQDTSDKYNNPWTVVNTCKRFPARLQLLRTFEKQLRRFSETPKDNPNSVAGVLYGLLDPSRPSVRGPVLSTYVQFRQKGISLQAAIQTFFLAALLYFYAYITWKFDLNDYAV